MSAVADQIARALGVDRCIVIYPAGPLQDRTAVDWIGLSAEQVVRTLYSVGDDVLKKRVPLPEPKAPPHE